MFLTLAAALILQTTQPGPAPACLAGPSRAQSWTPAQARRHREVWSDSLWLVNRVRRTHGERLAGAYVDVAGDEARLVFRVTGQERLPPMRLADRAKDARVVVEYGAPHSLKDVEAIRMRVRDRVIRLAPDLQGEGYDEATGTIQLDVYAADAAAEARVLAQCAALEAVYGMPVRIRPTAGRISLEAGRP